MAESKITDVKRIIQVELGSHRRLDSARDVHGYLAEGWVLLHIYSQSGPSDDGPTQTAICILGWTGEDTPPSVIAEEESREGALQELKAIIEMNRDYSRRDTSNDG